MKSYRQMKDAARQQAIDYQLEVQELEENGFCVSWYDVIEISKYFYNLGKRYGLLKEFKENGIL